MDASESSEDDSARKVPKHFTPLEDGYLVCGAMHLGLRWDAILEYMDFRSHITIDEMQKRLPMLVLIRHLTI